MAQRFKALLLAVAILTSGHAAKPVEMKAARHDEITIAAN